MRYQPPPEGHIPKKWQDHPCVECSGDGWVEYPTGITHHDFITYARETCEECGGTGERPEPDDIEGYDEDLIYETVRDSEDILKGLE